jgi:hypothetical protein
MIEAALKEWLGEVASGVRQSKGDFPKNVVPGCPIPFFGDILKARVLTIGVNPSNREFDPDRLWVEPLNVHDRQKRLLNYFNWPDVPACSWFETWSMCLEFLGVSYARGDAAHLDVSPRPTIPMLDKATDPAEFRKMAEHDVKWFFQLLGKIPQLQLLLVAGPIPTSSGNKQQLWEFIREHSTAHGCRWVEDRRIPKLVTISRPEGIPVFVCPYEAGVSGIYAMVRHVYRHRELLRQLAMRQMNSVPLMSDQVSWSSVIGNFITNFGMLDLCVQDFLEVLLSPAEFSKLQEKPFHVRVERIKACLAQTNCAVPDKAEFAQFFQRLEPLRKTRNHIAHGILRIGLAQDQKTFVPTLSLPIELGGSGATEPRHLEFTELLAELKTLNGLLEEFHRLTGIRAVARVDNAPARPSRAAERFVDAIGSRRGAEFR